MNFFKKNIYEIKKFYYPVLFRKINTTIKLLIYFFLSIITIPILFIIYSISSKFLIRFGELSDRIGHFTCNIELYLCKKKMKIDIPKQKYIDLFFCSNVCNYQLLSMWKKKIIILPYWFLHIFYTTNQFFSKLFKHPKKHKLIEHSSDKDIYNLYERIEPNLKFTKKEEMMGEVFFEKLKIPKNSKFAVFVVRDKHFLEKKYPYKDWTRHNARDQNLDNYLLAAEEVAKRGYYVFRVGGTPFLSKKFNHTNPRIIDYTHSNLRTDFLDIYLGAKCNFCVSAGSGYSGVPRIFRRPIVNIMGEPISFNTSSALELILMRPFLKLNENRRLNINEILVPEIASLSTTQEFNFKGLKMLDNTQEEIKDITIEMMDRLDDKWKDDASDEILQNNFWKKYSKMYNQYKIEYVDREKFPLMHGIIKARMGSSYLRDNFNHLKDL